MDDKIVNTDGLCDADPGIKIAFRWSWPASHPILGRRTDAMQAALSRIF